MKYIAIISVHAGTKRIKKKLNYISLATIIISQLR